MKNTKKYIPCVLTTIVLVFSVIGLLLIVLFKSYILSGNAMYDTLNKKDIYSKVYNAIDTYFSEQYNTTGIPKEVYMDAITQEEVTELTNQTTAEGIAYINNTSFTPSYDYSALDQSIDKFFEDYATSIDYTKDDAYYQKVQQTKDNAYLVLQYECDVFKLSTMKDAGLLDKVSKVTHYINYLMLGDIVLLVICVILLVLLNGKYFNESLYWISNTLMVSSVIMMLPCIYLKATDYFSAFTIKSDTIYHAVTGFLYGIVDRYLTMLIVSLVVGIVLMVIFGITNKPKKSNS